MSTKKELAAYEAVADSCCTPARYGHLAMSTEVTVENLGGLFEADMVFGD